LETLEAVAREKNGETMNVYEVILVTAVTCGFAVSYLAKLKGRDPFKWFLIGAVLNVFGVLIIFWATKPKAKPAVNGR
jgi:hypothetical protein